MLYVIVIIAIIMLIIIITIFIIRELNTAHWLSIDKAFK